MAKKRKLIIKPSKLPWADWLMTLSLAYYLDRKRYNKIYLYDKRSAKRLRLAVQDQYHNYGYLCKVVGNDMPKTSWTNSDFKEVSLNSYFAIAKIKDIYVSERKQALVQADISDKLQTQYYSGEDAQDQGAKGIPVININFYCWLPEEITKMLHRHLRLHSQIFTLGAYKRQLYPYRMHLCPSEFSFFSGALEEREIETTLPLQGIYERALHNCDDCISQLRAIMADDARLLTRVLEKR